MLAAKVQTLARALARETNMQPFEGIRVIDVTHVLAGPFATYQLALLGADVIKVEHPDDPDQSRLAGTDKELNRRNMGTAYLTQASNKRSITLDLKQARDRDILKKLVPTADVFVENYRPGAFEALGLGYDELAAINPRLIYASFSAFGQQGPRGAQTAYDHVIQATSGIMTTRPSLASEIPTVPMTLPTPLALIALMVTLSAKAAPEQPTTIAVASITT